MRDLAVSSASRLPATGRIAPLVSGAGFGLYLAFVVFYFLRPQAHWPALGVLRPTVILLALLVLIVLVNAGSLRGRLQNPITKSLLFFLGYVAVSLPFVEWPGSILRRTLEPFVLVVSFFFLSVLLVDSERRLARFVDVFIVCQLVRVLDPLRLHVTEGYWGSSAHMMNNEFLDRLAGAPWDVVNPNGLAFVCVTCFVFMHCCWFRHGGNLKRLIYLVSLPAMGYAFLLTSSRSGMVALAVAVVGLTLLARRRVVVVAITTVAVIAAGATMTESQMDRVRSLFDDTAANAQTAQGRTDAVLEDLSLALERPFVGTGLGTSPEAIANDGRYGRRSHNLYTEVFIETGLLGLLIYCVFIFKLLSTALRNLRRLLSSGALGSSLGARAPYWGVVLSTCVWLPMCMVFSLAQYGVSEWHWYFVAGLLVVAVRTADQAAIGVARPVGQDASATGGGTRRASPPILSGLPSARRQGG